MYTGFKKGPRACRPFMTTKLIIRFHYPIVIAVKNCYCRHFLSPRCIILNYAYIFIAFMIVF